MIDTVWAKRGEEVHSMFARKVPTRLFSCGCVGKYERNGVLSWDSQARTHGMWVFFDLGGCVERTCFQRVPCVCRFSRGAIL